MSSAVPLAEPPRSFAATEVPILASRASGLDGAKGNSDSEAPSVSASGRYLAFESRATNLVSEDTDAFSDVYVRDTRANTTILASRAQGPAGVKGDADSSQPSLSADGRWLAFTSYADNLVPGVGGEGPHVFLRDLATGEIVVVDRATGEDGAISTFDSDDPSVSADGRYVAFRSNSLNLEPGYGGDYQVYVRDMVTAETKLVSRASGASARTADGPSSGGEISADGSRIAFGSEGKNLVPNARVNIDATFVRDLENDETILVSRRSGRNGKVPNRGAYHSTISADGSRVAFATDANTLHSKDRRDSTDVYVRDLASHRTIYASRDLPRWGRKRPDYADGPMALSPDGRFVVFDLNYDGRNIVARATSRDLKKRRTETVAGAFTKANLPYGLDPSISANGRWLAFHSGAKRLHPEDHDAVVDVYLMRLRRR